MMLQLETQVVTGTATSVSSVNAANAVTVISAEKLNRAPAQTIDYALQGKIPGAIVTQNSGAPGGGVQVQLRGVSTINSSFLPLCMQSISVGDARPSYFALMVAALLSAGAMLSASVPSMTGHIPPAAGLVP